MFQNAGCWTTSSCGDRSECPARRQQRLQLEGRRRGGQHRCLATQTPHPLFISKHGGFAQHPRPVLQKEAPSQVRRDQERSRLRKEQSTKADQAGGNNFDIPSLTFSSLDTKATLQMTTQDTATEKCRPARTGITTDSSSKHNSENGSDVSNRHDFCQPEPLLFAACDDSLTHPTAEFDERFIKGRDAGFSVDIVKDYVATLTDRSVQRRLRDKQNSVVYQSGTGQQGWRRLYSV